MNTIQDVIKVLQLPSGNKEGSVDGLLTGDTGSGVTGIVTAFMPTAGVIDQAARLGANLVIAHEDPFYSHRGGIEIYRGSLVGQEKKRRIDASGIAVYRCHDYPHLCEPDGITEGLINALGWGQHVKVRLPDATIVEIPAATVRETALRVKEALGIPFLRTIGNPDMQCARIGVLAGYRGGGQTVIPLLENERLDLVIYGEGPEWESPEYIRDASYCGIEKALIVLGHAESEDPGMSFLAERLRHEFPMIPVHYVKDKPLFNIL
ncbi:Nif3-like dinuclear metal center hexameric protein [Paenibacillus sp. sptzw28]|nr:Nif3-like dinuclear metal center hexameric protein [Paenibacillus sp. sptzw28]